MDIMQKQVQNLTSLAQDCTFAFAVTQNNNERSLACLHYYLYKFGFHIVVE